MIKRLVCLSLFISFLHAQYATLRGKVIDESGEPIIAALVFIPKIKKGTYTNNDGLFSIDKIPVGTYEVIVSSMGYDTLKQTIDLSYPRTYTVSWVLSVQAIQLEAVEIVEEAQDVVIERKKVTTAVTRLTPKQIEVIPSLGAPDLAQYLQVLPGVVFTGDQGGQLYIRGGTPIMNKTLLDGAIIYSPFHSIGLFSVFDLDYIRSADVYSAAFPANYGGRISSIIDIRTRNGNFQRFTGKLYANPITAGLLVEGPIMKPKEGEGGISYLISARHAYLNQTSKTLYPYVNDTLGLPFSFSDFYSKFTIGAGANSISFFGFHQQDQVLYGYPVDVLWRSSGGGSRFMLLPTSSDLIFTGGFAYSRFKSQVINVSENFPKTSSINGFNGFLDFSYIFNSIDEFAYGIEILGFTTDYIYTNALGFQARQRQSNTEFAVYTRYKKVLLSKHKQLADGTPFERAVIEPSVRFHYYNNYNYISLEPRLRAKLNFEGWSLSAGIGRFAQNLMAAVSDRDIVNLFQGFVAAPEDLPDKRLKHNLQVAWHYLLGVEIQIARRLKGSVEAWYKDFKQVTAINRDRLFPNDPLFITETGYAYGTDFIITYRTPSLYVYLVYGLMKTERFAPQLRYAPIWDRRHNLNFVAEYRIGNLISRYYSEARWRFSLRWNLGSGLPFTQTQAFYEQLSFILGGAQTNYITQNGNLGIVLSDAYNQARLPYYHRLDIAIKRYFALSERMLLQIYLSVINVYNRANIFYFDRIRYRRIDQLPILPTLGIQFNF